MTKWTEKSYRGFDTSHLPEIREKLVYKGPNIPGPYPIFDKKACPGINTGT
jgi:hypothetical protein